jgi:hypothetical protein
MRGGVNYYAYTLNSPVSARDPFGLDSAADVAAAPSHSFLAAFGI